MKEFTEPTLKIVKKELKDIITLSGNDNPPEPTARDIVTPSIDEWDD